MTLSADLFAAAGEVLDLFAEGVTAQIERAAGGYDADDGAAASTPTPTLTTVKCSPPMANQQRNRVDGPAGAADAVFWIQSADITPTTADVLVRSGVRWTIAEVGAPTVGSTAIAYRLTVRKGAG